MRTKNDEYEGEFGQFPAYLGKTSNFAFIRLPRSNKRNMVSQTLWNKFHEFVIQAEDKSDLLILAQIGLSIWALLISEPPHYRTLLFLHIVLIHYLTKLLKILPGFPVLTLICSLLSWAAKYQIARVYFRCLSTIPKPKPKPEKLEWGLGPNGYLEWLTPLKKKQAKRVDGFMIPESPRTQADEWGSWGLDTSGGIVWQNSRRMNGSRTHKVRKYESGFKTNETQGNSGLSQNNGVKISHVREGLGLSDWTRQWNKRPLGHLEWLTGKYDDLCDSKSKKTIGLQLLLEQENQVLVDFATHNPDAALNDRLQLAIRKTMKFPASTEKARFAWDDLAKGKVAFT